MSRLDRLQRHGTTALAFGILMALIATSLPVLRVVAPGAWTAGALGLAALILGVGALLRRLRTPAVGVTLAALALWVVAVTAVFFRDSAWFGVVPSPVTLRAVGDAVAATTQQISTGVAPLPPTPELSFFMVAAVSLLAIVLDHVVITTRMPLLAAVALVSVALVPAIAVPAPMDVGAFVLLGLSILFLLRTDTRTRTRTREAARPSTSAGASVVAALIGVAAVVVAVLVTPILPAPDDAAGLAVSGGASGIDPTLSLGEDLRRPNPVEVLRLRTSDVEAPYLRAVTLSTFAGVVWQPDDPEAERIGSGAGFGPVRADPQITRETEATHVEVQRLNTPYLPVPFPATAIDGLTGDWGVVAENRTVIGLGSDTSGQSYDVSTETPRPTLAQMRAASSRESDLPPAYSDVPRETPALVTQLAQEVTAGTTTDYDAVSALQQWFRSSEFSYSLDAPVDEGFDGGGVEALEQFLIEREGYCVHFASAFAVMTRSLGMPTRVVIGYLPGRGTSDTVDDRMVYSVTSDLLHSWPEVFFEGIGWVAFEPTNSLGAPPAFASGGSAPTGPQDAGPAVPVPTAVPTTAPTERADTPNAPSAGGSTGATGLGTLWPATGVLALLIALLLVPAVARAVWRHRQGAAARSGDAASAWVAVQSIAIDLGIPVPPSESARAFGARLTARGAPADAVSALVAAVERASYAPAGYVTAGRVRSDRSLDDALAAVTAGLREHAAPLRRSLAVIMPRSLLIRPGSAAAGAGEVARARRP
jgi:transglutaminase-like putative cysteine protease